MWLSLNGTWQPQLLHWIIFSSALADTLLVGLASALAAMRFSIWTSIKPKIISIKMRAIINCNPNLNPKFRDWLHINIEKRPVPPYAQIE